MREATVFQGQRGLIAAIAGVSVGVNLLILTAPLYMIQLFERVMTSGSHATLAALTIGALLALGFFFVFDLLRQRMAARLGARLDARLGPALFEGLLRGSDQDQPEGVSPAQPLIDLTELRGFVTGPAFIALLDAPWAALFVGVIWLFHPVLGMIALGGVLTLLLLGVAGELFSRGHARFAADAARRAQAAAEDFLRNVEVTRAMGRAPALAGRWADAAAMAQAGGALATDRIALMTSLAKFVRMALQIAMMGAGVSLVLAGQMAPGLMIAAAILLGRAAAPVEQSIAGWRALMSARQALDRLNGALARLRAPRDGLELPPPQGRVEVEHATVIRPERQEPLLFDVSFALAPGDALGLIGPSGAGKTTLARALAGLQPLSRGHVRIDGAALEDWPEDQIGRHVGFMPQRIELMEGTVAENIAGMDPEVAPAQVVEAARRAGVHEMILALPGGYNARVGPRGERLSAGQRQRIGLARALLGERRLIVLDEPNSNLDPEGEAALARAVRGAGERGATVVVVTHRLNILAQLSHAAVLEAGRLIRFGPAREVLRQIGRPAVVPAAGARPRALAGRGARS
ncbi:type I secretion system permease/ATPase [Oceanicella actignis]|uniref:type I secretion system permease/ATPase n=1 Tax=Oceanicella actignis TaxID=1189325 RepID=UPI0011E87952|nr:type I secretion system permease/ATPase [Oceanicella actignis]TYO90843.1 ATP-binding cassette subfamily C protein EexD [Oceanicella actignis]